MKSWFGFTILLATSVALSAGVLCASAQVVKNSSFTTPSGEMVLRHEVVVSASIQNVWEAFTTLEGVKTWMVPVAEVELKHGGKYYTHYSSDARIGDPGSIYNTVLCYVPMEVFCFKVNLNEGFPEIVRNEDEDLFYVVQFEEIDDGQVKLTGSMLGWKQGEEWEQTYKKFDWGNRYTFEQLNKRFVDGPIDFQKRKTPVKLPDPDGGTK